MSIFGDLDNMVLFNANHPPLGNKAGSPLTPAEWDARITAIYDAIQSIVSGQNVTAYNAGRTYDQFSTDIYDQYASYDGKIWKAVYAGSPSGFSGQTPEDGVYWEQVTLAELMPNVMKLAEVSSSSGVVIKEASLTIPSADVLQLNSTPQTIVSGVASKLIVPVSALLRATYGGTPYATNLDIDLRHTGSSTELTSNAAKLGFTADTINQFAIKADNASDQMIVGADLEVFVDSGNPTAGNSDITIDVTYYEI